MDKAAIETWLPRSRALDVDGIAWDELGRVPLGAASMRTLRYMQDIESHTVVYVRQLLATRAIDDPDVATFLACWFYEETFHGRALARVLSAAGDAPVVRQRSRQSWSSRLEECALRTVSRVWPDFVAVHMTWGAINELTTLTAYQRLVELEPHPVLAELLGRIMRDESRHFAFYYHQAERRLAGRRARRVARALIDRFWAPVGSGVQPDGEVCFLAAHLFGGDAGRAAARRIDATIRRLPGFEDVALVEAWVERATRMRSPHAEGTLEHEAATRPRQRAHHARRRRDRAGREHTEQRREQRRRGSEGGIDPLRIRVGLRGDDRIGGETAAVHGRTDALAGEVTRQPGRVADEHEMLAREAP